MGMESFENQERRKGMCKKPTDVQREYMKQMAEYYDQLIQIEEGKVVMEVKDYSLLGDEMAEFIDACMKKQREALDKLKEEIVVDDDTGLVSIEQLETRYVVNEKEEKNNG